MDIQREDVAARRKKRRILMIGGTVLVIALVAFGLSQLKPPVYKVDESSVWVETVKRGELLREVSGSIEGNKENFYNDLGIKFK